MQAEQVIGKILADARAEADKIRKQAEEREAAEQARQNEELARFEQETQALAAKAAAEEKSQRLAVARMEMAKEHLAGKAAILDEVFHQAREQIQKLPDDQYREMMARLMAAAVERGDEQVIVRRNDSRIDGTLIDAVNGRLRDRGKGNLTLADRRHDLGGGFLLQRGKVRTNVTIDVLIARARNDLEIGLAKELFSKEADANRTR